MSTEDSEHLVLVACKLHAPDKDEAHIRVGYWLATAEPTPGLVDEYWIAEDGVGSPAAIILPPDMDQSTAGHIIDCWYEVYLMQDKEDES